jgi:enoyl-CoA hydratase/carnithine racemase
MAMIETIDHGPVRELRLANPPVNALGYELVTRLTQAIESAPAAGCRALVLSGRPGLFCGGLDVREVAGADAARLQTFLFAFRALQVAIVNSSIPIVAALTGHSPAGGTVLAIYCDHRIMARGAFRIGLNEVEVGMSPGATIYRAFERLVGSARAAQWVPTGRLVTPDEALTAGLVEELQEPDAVVPRALELAAQLVALPPIAYARTRALARRELVDLMASPASAADGTLDLGWITAETRERMQALLARVRAPR